MLLRSKLFNFTYLLKILESTHALILIQHVQSESRTLDY